MKQDRKKQFRRKQVMLPCNSYYGGYRTRTFANIFPSAEEFNNAITEMPFDKETIDLNLVYYLLYARYGNSNIAFSDENQFKFSVGSIIFQYGLTWTKRLDVQKKLRALSDAELLTGGKAIYNHSFNPSTEPSTNTLDELLTVNDQNTTNYKKSKMEAYAYLMELLETDVTEEFIGKFKKLFLSVVAPDYPLLYENTIMEVE